MMGPMSRQHRTGEDAAKGPGREPSREPSRGAGGAPERRVRWLAAVVLLAWFALAGAGGPLVGRLSEVQKNDNASFLPASAESTAVNAFTQRADDTRLIPYLVVIERTAGLTPDDLTAVAAYVNGIPALTLPADPARTLGPYLVAPPQGALPSQDRQALLLPVQLLRERASETVEHKSVLFEVAEALRASARDSLGTRGLTVHVTGPGGFLADFVTAFGGIDGILLLVALGVVFVILLVVYRSPLLPFAVLVTAVLGLSLAALVLYPLARDGAIDLSGQSQGILSILVVGAATDYALLLVARYREELHQHASSWAAMRIAWRAAVEPVAASAATVVLGLLCLRLSELGNTRGLGPVGAFGILGALVAALTFLPAVLLLCGRRIFWPLAPRVDHVHAEDAVGRSGLWGRVAAVVGAHPRRTWTVTLVALLGFAAFVPTFEAKGVTQSDFFLTRVDSVAGQETLVRHYPAGSGSPVQIVTPQDKAAQVVQVLGTVSGVRDPFIGEAPGLPPRVVDGRVRVQVTLEAAADSTGRTGGRRPGPRPRRAPHGLPEPALRPGVLHHAAAGRRRCPRHPLPRRAALGTLATRAEGAVAGAGRPGRRRRTAARPAHPPPRPGRAAVRAGGVGLRGDTVPDHPGRGRRVPQLPAHVRDGVARRRHVGVRGARSAGAPARQRGGLGPGSGGRGDDRLHRVHQRRRPAPRVARPG